MSVGTSLVVKIKLAHKKQVLWLSLKSYIFVTIVLYNKFRGFNFYYCSLVHGIMVNNMSQLGWAIISSYLVKHWSSWEVLL